MGNKMTEQDKLDMLMNVHAPFDPNKEFKIKWPEQCEKACITYWLPKLEGLPVPKTAIIESGITAKEQINYADCIIVDDIKSKLKQLYIDIDKRASLFGYPVFLRTGQLSAKHEWIDTCFLQKKSDIPNHIDRIILASCLAGVIGLPADIWVVREFLELESEFNAFDGIPISKEFRFFVEDGKINHIQPYWPEYSIKNPSVKNWKRKLKKISSLDAKEEHDLYSLVNEVAYRFKNDIGFSVDLCKTKTGEWYITDMAPGKNSFKWDGNN